MRHHVWIVEDDYDSEFRFAARPLPALQGLDEHGRVLYLGTFSKTLFPSMRLAYLVVPRDRFQSKVGLLLRTEKSVLFVIPWGRHWLIGTTDNTGGTGLTTICQESRFADPEGEEAQRILRESTGRDTSRPNGA